MFSGNAWSFSRGGQNDQIVLACRSFCVAAVVLVLTIRHTLGLFRDKADGQMRVESRHNTILFWCSISLVIGFFGHLWEYILQLRRSHGRAP